MATFALTLMLGVLSLAVDLGWGYFRREAGQSAADAAVAAAVSIVTGTPACGTGNVWCGSPAGTITNCPGTPSASPSSTYDYACKLAYSNGYSTTGSTVVSVQANTTTPPPTVPGVAVNYWVTVRISESPATFFGKPFGFSSLSALSSNVIATAGVVTTSSASNESCMYILGNSGTTFTLGNGATASTSGCGVYVNSTTTTGNGAMYVTGGARLNSNWAKVVGSDVHNNGACLATSSSASCGSLTPSTGQSAVTDPFAGLTEPANPGGCQSGNMTAWQASPYTPSPGCYNEFSLANGMSATMAPGAYYINGGVFSIQGGSTLTSTGGVTIYLANGAYVNIANGSTVNLAAQTSGSYEGVLFFQQRDYSGQTGSTFAGGSNTTLTGSIYMPNSEVTFDNGSSESSTMALVVNSVNFEGGTTVLVQATSQSQTGLPVSSTSYSVLQ